MITITDAAVAAAKAAMTQAGQTDGGLRISVRQGGCAGYQYVVDLDPQVRGDDIIVEADGLQVFIDPASRPQVEGLSLGYRSDLTGSGFTFQNPNATSTCGCQKSFN